MIAVIITLLLAMLLDIGLLPSLSAYLPEWTLLVTIYWVLYLPLRINIGLAWSIGLCMDILHDTSMGVYALCYLVSAMIIYLFHQRVRYYPLWQQCLVIFSISMLVQLIALWFRTEAPLASGVLSYFIMPVSNAFLWPLVAELLLRTRQRFQI
ncbi:MAG: rod shape-determining protein MreD [Gammaproteobacteria bacterium]|nr:MAG: rod shape-determining protein MreD [Gammaproteobacteria bacterium]